jgi:hypothetical protein
VTGRRDRFDRPGFGRAGAACQAQDCGRDRSAKGRSPAMVVGNMSGFKSWRSFWDFNHAVRRKSRYVRAQEHEEFLATIAETSRGRKIALKGGACLWRAQLGHDWREERQEDDTFEVQCAYSPERMKPFSDKAYDGRANPKGIPCLYLANSKETAMSEVRPWVGSYVSVGQFKVLRDQQLIDCSRAHKAESFLLSFPFEEREPQPSDIEKAVWSDINRAFAEPMTRSDDSADYVATQILAELFKKEGFDGIVYKSNFGEEGYNIALFDIAAADLINCVLYQVDSIEFKFSQADNMYYITKHYEGKAKAAKS